MNDDEIVDQMFLAEALLSERLSHEDAEWVLIKLVEFGWAPKGLQEHTRIQALEAELRGIKDAFEWMFKAFAAAGTSLSAEEIAEFTVLCADAAERLGLVLDAAA